jgi:hypothetical protein
MEDSGKDIVRDCNFKVIGNLPPWLPPLDGVLGRMKD